MLNLTSRGADFSKSYDYVPPVSAGLQYLNFFHGGGDVVGRNLAPEGNSPQVVGTPTYGAGFATLTGGLNFLQTSIQDSSTFTLMAAFRGRELSSGKFPMVIGSFRLAPQLGSNLIITSATSVIGTRGTNTGSADTFNAVTETVTSAETWRLACVRCDGSILDMLDLTTNVAVSVGVTAPYRGGLAYRIGNDWSGGAPYAGAKLDIAFAAILNRKISDAERTSLAAVARSMALKDGIAV